MATTYATIYLEIATLRPAQYRTRGVAGLLRVRRTESGRRLADYGRRRGDHQMVHVAAPGIAATVLDDLGKLIVEGVVQVPMNLKRIERAFMLELVLSASLLVMVPQPKPAEP